MRMNKEVVMVRLSDIIPNRFQPRLTFDEEALNELANSIKEHGIIQPLILRDLGSKYEIIAGERRYKAATLAGLTEVPAIVGSMDDQTSAELALIENIQRKDLSAIEEAKSYKKILDMGNFTQDELAKRMGKSQSTIANKMRLLALTNEVQVALMNNLISERHVRDTDEYIKNMLGISNETPKEAVTPVVPPVQVTPEEPVVPASTIANEPKTLDIPVPPQVEKKDDNPNVYAQNKNDFIDINKLNEVKAPVTSALEGLNIVENKSDIFDGNTVMVEDKKEKNMNEVPNAKDAEQAPNSINKVKLATAIKIAKDALDSITAAGYNVTMEEVDGLTDYQIIIKVEK